MIIILLGLFLGLLFPKSIIVNLYLSVLVFALFAFSVDSYDYLNYQGVYESLDDSIFEPLYTGLMILANRMGLDFPSFRIVTASLIVLPFNFFLWKATNKPNIILALYLIFSSFYDATLTRNSLAMVAAIWAFYFLLKCEKRKGYYLFILFSVIASLFHSAYWVLLIILPCWVLIGNGYKRIYTVSLILFTIIVFFFSQLLFNAVESFHFNDLKFEEYNTGRTLNGIGTLYFILKYFLIVSPVLFFRHNGNTKTGLFNTKELNSLCYVFALIAALQFILPGYMRLLRILVIFIYIFLINQSSNTKRYHQALITALVYATVLLALTVLWEMPETYDTIIKMHFTTNPILNYFSLNG